MMTTPQTEYVYVQDKGTGQKQQQPQQTGPTGKQTAARQQVTRQVRNQANIPRGMPRFLGNRQVLVGSWFIAIALVSWDEWDRNGILPRPLRLWDVTMVYAGLAVVSVIDVLVPIANALAIGYTVVLLYQFFNGTGQFGSVSGGTATLAGLAAAGAGAATATASPAAATGQQGGGGPSPGSYVIS
jgi:hypothetical protein